MIKNRHLSKAVQNQGFFEFRKQLEYKCNDRDFQASLNLKAYGEQFAS